MREIGVGIIGSGFVAEIHAESLRRVPGAWLVGVASPTQGRTQALATKHGAPHAFTDYRRLLALPEIQLISLCLPNDLHCEATLAAATAGKHVLCEKPLCVSLDEADRMIEACRRAGVQLMYAEELCFTPKYVRAKQLADEGALGEVYLVKQSEKHDGPHVAWFWDVQRSGGGVTLAIYAAYESARTGRKVPIPFTPPEWATKPIHCWKPRLAAGCPEELKLPGPAAGEVR